jgi:hypothetical protein
LPSHVIWLSLLVMLGTIVTTVPANGGRFGPEVPVGWANRLVWLAYAAWLMTTAWRALVAHGRAAGGAQGRAETGA